MKSAARSKVFYLGYFLLSFQKKKRVQTAWSNECSSTVLSAKTKQRRAFSGSPHLYPKVIIQWMTKVHKYSFTNIHASFILYM